MYRMNLKLNGLKHQKILFHITAFPHPGIQDLLADAQRLRSHFQKFIGVDKVERLFQAEDARRCEPERFIGAG